MTIRSTLLFALRMLFPRTSKRSDAQKNLISAVFCIGISIVPLVVVLSVSNGMIHGITERIIELSSAHLKIVLYPDTDGARSAKSLTVLSNKIKDIDKRVLDTYAEIDGMGLAAGKNGRTGAAIRAVESGMFKNIEAYSRLFVVESGEANLPNKKSAVIGHKISEILGLKCGDSFRLITTKMTPSGNIVPTISSFTVSGIVSCGYQELDALWVFVPLESGFDILPRQSSEITVRVETVNAFSPDITDIQQKIRHLLGSGARVIRWDEINKNAYENFASTKVMLMFIMMLIVLVACVNVCSALIMLSMERQKEIAILKSIGGSRGGITLSFLITGFVSGVGGALIGIPAGLFFAVNINRIINIGEKAVNFTAKVLYLFNHADMSGYVDIELLDPAYYLQTIPVIIPFRDLLIMGTGTLILSLAASAFPAIRAGKEKPLDTLRKL